AGSLPATLRRWADELAGALVHGPGERDRGLGAGRALGGLGPGPGDPAARPPAPPGLAAGPAPVPGRPGPLVHRGPRPVGARRQLRPLQPGQRARPPDRGLASAGRGLGHRRHVPAAGGRADLPGPAPRPPAAVAAGSTSPASLWTALTPSPAP